MFTEGAYQIHVHVHVNSKSTHGFFCFKSANLIDSLIYPNAFNLNLKYNLDLLGSFWILSR